MYFSFVVFKRNILLAYFCILLDFIDSTKQKQITVRIPICTVYIKDNYLTMKEKHNELNR